MGYMWLWLGSFMRWQRRFFVASEAPGLLLIYKRSGLKGKVRVLLLVKYTGARVLPWEFMVH